MKGELGFRLQFPDDTFLSNLPADCRECRDSAGETSSVSLCRFYKEKRRRNRFSITECNVYICSGKLEHIESKRRFKEATDNLLKLVPELPKLRKHQDKFVQRRIRRLIHNLIPLNAKSMQAIYALVSESELEKSQSGQIAIVRDVVKSRPIDVAATLLRLLRWNKLMKTQFAVFASATDTSSEFRRKSHRMHKVLLSVAHGFFQEFNEVDVELQIECSGIEVSVDYHTFTVALFLMLENAQKYCKPKTKLKIFFEKLDRGGMKMVWEMMSLKINENEIETIFDEGISGKFSSSLGSSGEGLGMHVVRELLKRNMISIAAIPNFDKRGDTLHMGVPFALNRFELIFPENIIRMRNT